ncbi:hypothetical protein EV368DRAFT_61460 [Lentinula lateritia]|uniref:Uncharacterized protein n=1 Tax=Lentinula aff. lateritia TaxID=2804960 RepID=A0ACC1TV57_9AGAR|nr:hypothetical protein F5876DRAFT_67208 [Lentinula aff. lateritia]KAJ3856716.1 hypothetical protein EV368DRAFT_61460 [Lentinula lateritia]
MTSSFQNGITQNGTIVHNILNGITVKLCPPSSEAYRSIIPQLAVLLKSCVDTNITMNFLQPFSIENASAFWLSAEEKVVQMKQFVLIAQESQEAQEKDAYDHVFRHEQHEPPVILGCVVLYLAQTPNANHRGEVGIGKMLLDRMEDEARKHSLKILVLVQNYSMSALDTPRNYPYHALEGEELQSNLTEENKPLLDAHTFLEDRILDVTLTPD